MTESTVEQTAPDVISADTSTAAADAGKPKQDHSGFQRRIDQLTREKHDLRRQLEAHQRPAPKESTEVADKSLADFDYDEPAYRKHIREVASEEARKAARGVLDETKRSEVKQSRAKTWKERSAAFAAEHADFTTKVYADDIHISDSMMEAITDSDVGPQIAYYLADNPEEAERIANMSAAAAGRAIGRLESKFEGKKADPTPEPEELKEEDEPEAKRVTKAPEPPPKIGGASAVGASISTTSSASDKLSDDEWFKRENQRLAKLRKA